MKRRSFHLVNYVLLVAILSASLYGQFFLKPPDPNTLAGKAQLATPPFWRQPLVWGIAAVTVVLAGLITAMTKARG